MMTGPLARDDRRPGNGQREPAAAAGAAGGDPFDARRVRLAGLWALVLQRFRITRTRTPTLPPAERGGSTRRTDDIRR